MPKLEHEPRRHSGARSGDKSDRIASADDIALMFDKSAQAFIDRDKTIGMSDSDDETRFGGEIGEEDRSGEGSLHHIIANIISGNNDAQTIGSGVKVGDDSTVKRAEKQGEDIRRVAVADTRRA